MKPTPKLILPIVWLCLNSTLIAGTLVLLISTTISGNRVQQTRGYSIFSAKPLVLGFSTAQISQADSRAAMLNSVFEKYQCPLTGFGDVFVTEADANDIPFWLVAAVSFQESNCGKKTPEVAGQESYNAWGWGVWGDNVKTFANWQEGIEVVSKYMATKFHSQGVIDPCEIMKTYTPPSNGSWCNGVNFFSDVIKNYKSPDNV